MCDSLYLNPLADFKQCCTLYENKNQREKIVRLNTVILTKVKLKKKNEVALPAKDSNELNVYEIRSGAVYVFDESHYKILETIFLREEFNHIEFI